MAEPPMQQMPPPRPLSLLDLPRKVLDDILCRLPSKDAGRTSVLSHSWRFRWRSIPNLDLSDVSDRSVLQALRLHVGPIRFLKVQTGDSSAVESLIADVNSATTLVTLILVDNFTYSLSLSIQLRDIARCFPRLNHLYLAYCKLDMIPDYDNDDGRPEFADLQTLHINEVKFEASQLSMFVPFCPSLEALTVDFQDSCGYDFSCDLSSIAGVFPCLSRLKLRYCDLHVRQPVGEILQPDGDILQPDDGYEFTTSAIKSIELVRSTLYSKLSDLLSACPLLEALCLNRTHLHLEEEGEGGRCLHIAAAPNLRSLKIVNVGDGIIDFSIKHAPILETIKLDFRVRNEKKENHGRKFMNQVFGSVPRIVKLELYNNVLRFLKRGRIPRKMPVMFDHLRHMWLEVNLRDTQELLVTLCLLRSAPNLQELELQGLYLITETRRAGKDFWEAQEHGNLSDKLETVKMTLIKCYKVEVDFIQFVLAKAYELKTMIISFHYDVNKELAMKKLSELPVASNQAQIIFML